MRTSFSPMGTVAYAIPIVYQLLPHIKHRAVTIPPILFTPFTNVLGHAVTYRWFPLISPPFWIWNTDLHPDQNWHYTDLRRFLLALLLLYL
jgi:hypothetical protein